MPVWKCGGTFFFCFGCVVRGGGSGGGGRARNRAGGRGILIVGRDGGCFGGGISGRIGWMVGV